MSGTDPSEYERMTCQRRRAVTRLANHWVDANARLLGAAIRRRNGGLFRLYSGAPIGMIDPSTEYEPSIFAGWTGFPGYDAARLRRQRREGLTVEAAALAQEISG